MSDAPKNVAQMSLGDLAKRFKGLLIGACIVGLVLLTCAYMYSHLKTARQAEVAFFEAQDSLQLPAPKGVFTSFKDVEKSLQDAWSQYQSVAVASIGLRCETKEITHQEDDRFDIAQGIARGARTEDVATMERYNRVAVHGTFSDGFDVSWLVDISFTRRLKRQPGNTKPFSVEWLCPDQLLTRQLPLEEADSLPAVAFAKYGIAFTRVSRMDLTSASGWRGKGTIAMNVFNLELFNLRDSLSKDPKQRLFDSPIKSLEWNGTPIAHGEYTSDHREQAALLQLVAWATNCVQMMSASALGIHVAPVTVTLTCRLGHAYAYSYAYVIKVLEPAHSDIPPGASLYLAGEAARPFLNGSNGSLDGSGQFQVTGILYAFYFEEERRPNPGHVLLLAQSVSASQ